MGDYFERKLDDKRRLSLPAELRGFQKNYLHLYPKSVWDEMVEPQLQGNILDEATADLNVQFRMGKYESAIDQKQGRFTLEQHLLDYAGIGKDIMAVRAGRYWRVMRKE
jgi:DNA-binding transcriptional regulator/RsmH inhibitor MraZ